MNQAVFRCSGENAGTVFSGSGHGMELKFSQMTSIASFFRIWYMDQHYLNKNQSMTLPLMLPSWHGRGSRVPRISRVQKCHQRWETAVYSFVKWRRARRMEICTWGFEEGIWKFKKAVSWKKDNKGKLHDHNMKVQTSTCRLMQAIWQIGRAHVWTPVT